MPTNRFAAARNVNDVIEVFTEMKEHDRARAVAFILLKFPDLEDQSEISRLRAKLKQINKTQAPLLAWVRERAQEPCNYWDERAEVRQFNPQCMEQGDACAMCKPCEARALIFFYRTGGGRVLDRVLGQHWWEVAAERMTAGESEAEVMRDYGYTRGESW